MRKDQGEEAISPAIVTRIIRVAAIARFVMDKLPMGLAAFCVPLALYFTGIIEAASKEGVVLQNLSNTEPLVILRHFARKP